MHVRFCSISPVSETHPRPGTDNQAAGLFRTEFTKCENSAEHNLYSFVVKNACHVHIRVPQAWIVCSFDSNVCVPRPERATIYQFVTRNIWPFDRNDHMFWGTYGIGALEHCDRGFKYRSRYGSIPRFSVLCCPLWAESCIGAVPVHGILQDVLRNHNYMVSKFVSKEKEGRTVLIIHGLLSFGGHATYKLINSFKAVRKWWRGGGLISPAFCTPKSDSNTACQHCAPPLRCSTNLKHSRRLSLFP
jgi:hypothetical protein